MPLTRGGRAGSSPGEVEIASVAGRVVDESGAPIAALLVSVCGAQCYNGKTDANGYYTVTISTVPTYYLSRAWVWQKRGKSSIYAEIIPFWVMTFLGLLLSTLCVVILENQYPDTPILVLTSEDGPGIEQRVLELGADDYIIKPFDPTLLLSRVNAVFRRLKAMAA